jgi:hypothetical protein
MRTSLRDPAIARQAEPDARVKPGHDGLGEPHSDGAVAWDERKFWA